MRILGRSAFDLVVSEAKAGNGPSYAQLKRFREDDSYLLRLPFLAAARSRVAEFVGLWPICAAPYPSIGADRDPVISDAKPYR